jgi:SAM-dependent methyltransferase
VNLYSLFLSAVVVGAPATAAQHEHGSRHGSDPVGPTVDHRFEDADAWAARFEDPDRDAWQLPERVVEVLCDRPDLVVADIGSATGYFPVRFARACPEGLTIGADVEPTMVRYLNDRAREEELTNLVSVLAAPDDPHLPQRVDLVFICNTYHHIGERADYFRRLQRQLRPGARVAIVDYRLDSGRGPAHKLAPETIEREMREAGYIVTERHDFLPDQYFLVFSVAG